MSFDLGQLPESLQLALGDDAILEELDGEICVRSESDPPRCVFFPVAAPPSELESSFISTVVSRHASFIGRAIHFLSQHSMGYRNIAEDISQPQFLFRPKFEFDIHFQFCGVDTCNNGVLVSFRREDPIDVSLLNDFDTWWDDNAKTWVPA
jgi:hypothetical protein